MSADDDFDLGPCVAPQQTICLGCMEEAEDVTKWPVVAFLAGGEERGGEVSVPICPRCNEDLDSDDLMHLYYQTIQEDDAEERRTLH